MALTQPGAGLQGFSLQTLLPPLYEHSSKVLRSGQRREKLTFVLERRVAGMYHAAEHVPRVVYKAVDGAAVAG